MNYRHSFHAGNFADIVKHALLLWLIDERQGRGHERGRGPLSVIDTHAGAGLYDLSGDASRSREAEAGIERLMMSGERPPLIEALARQVEALNPEGGVRFYPGSPLLVARALRQDDLYLGFEMNPPVADLLVAALADYPQAQGRAGDGYEAVVEASRQHRSPLVLIDPPFEQPDDYVRSAEVALKLIAQDRTATVAIWTPLKDMETFDGFLRRLSGPELNSASVLVAEARLRPLSNPMKMNGCAMVVVNPPVGCEAAANEICGWVADRLGDDGAKGEVWMA